MPKAVRRIEWLRNGMIRTVPMFASTPRSHWRRSRRALDQLPDDAKLVCDLFMEAAQLALRRVTVAFDPSDGNELRVFRNRRMRIYEVLERPSLLVEMPKPAKQSNALRSYRELCRDWSMPGFPAEASTITAEAVAAGAASVPRKSRRAQDAEVAREQASQSVTKRHRTSHRRNVTERHKASQSVTV